MIRISRREIFPRLGKNSLSEGFLGVKEVLVEKISQSQCSSGRDYLLEIFSDGKGFLVGKISRWRDLRISDF